MATNRSQSKRATVVELMSNPRYVDRTGAHSQQSMDHLSKSTRTLVVSYLSIRRGIGMIGFALPLILGPIGWLFFGIEIQDNMSSYYHTALRDVFVGALCAIGIFLYCYEGYDWIESWTGNLGCISALGVALFPLDPNSDPLYQRSIVGYLHTFFGGAFFLTLAFYSLYHFPRRPDPNAEISSRDAERNFVYRSSGIVILLSMLMMGAYLFAIPPELKAICNDYNLLFWLEWIAVWAFASAWLTKGHAIFAEIAIELMAVPTHLLRKRTKDR